MKNNVKRLSVICAVSAAILAMTPTGSAQALGIRGLAGCTTTGVQGAGTFENWTNKYADISMTAYDTKEDGHHVAIRFISKEDVDGPIRYWSWHHNNDDGHISVSTSASTAQGGLSYIGLQAAVFEGSDLIRSCKDWAEGS